jgi:hypothetical protein
MAMRQQDDSLWRSVILYGTAAVIILSLLPGCSGLSNDEVAPKVELTQAERVADLKKRLLATHQKMHMQRAELQKLLGNEADLERLIRLMHVKQQKMQLTGDSAGRSEEVTVDYLQVMAANQAALKSDLSTLMAELNALTATASK